MRLSFVLALLGGLLLLVAWRMGALALLGWWVVGLQRDLQGLLAGRIAALRAGEPHALAALLGGCAGYGFLHAVGPGHGQAARRAPPPSGPERPPGAWRDRGGGQPRPGAAAILLIYGGMALVGATARAAWAPRGLGAVGGRRRRGRRRPPGSRSGACAPGGRGRGPGRTAPTVMPPTPTPPMSMTMSLPMSTILTGPAAAAAITAQARRRRRAARGLRRHARPGGGDGGAAYAGRDDAPLAVAWSMGLAAAGAAGALAMGLGAGFTALVAPSRSSGARRPSPGSGPAAASCRRFRSAPASLLATSAGALLVAPLLV